MINEKPKDLKYQRNLNVLVIGGTGSGKNSFCTQTKSYADEQFL